MTKYIHAFSDPITDEIDQSLIGNKGYNLCLMHGMDLPIPEGFIINAKAAKEFKKNLYENENYHSPSLQRILNLLRTMQKSIIILIISSRYRLTGF